MANYTDVDKSTDFFNTVLWEGNNTIGHSIRMPY